ncbi:MAG: FxsA family protein [Nocardioides sp.]
MRKWIPWWLLVLLFVVVPVAEVYLLIQVGQAIGGWWTVLLLLGSGFLGGYLVKREGARAWRALQTALAEHRMPARELADGALVLVGGTLLLTPGFISDAAGLACILPVTRPLMRRVLTKVVTRKLAGGSSYAAFTMRRPGEGPQARQLPGTDESVVRGDVVD